VAAGEILYAAPNGSGTSCTQVTPCTLAVAYSKVSAQQDYILLASGNYTGGAFSGKSVTIVATTATITAPSAGSPVLDFGSSGSVVLEGAHVTGDAPGADASVTCESGTAKVKLVDVTIDHNGSGHGVEVGTGCSMTIVGSTIATNLARGVFGFVGSSVTIDQSTIRDNGDIGVVGGGALAVTRSMILSNKMGGVDFGGTTLTLVNDVIAGNGTMFVNPSSFGGVSIEVNPTAATVDFNTISNNQTGSNAAGVQCASVTVARTFHDNIVYGNTGGVQTGGANCAYAYSDVGPGGAPSGTGNIGTAPTFVNASAGDFHLVAGSAGIDVADPAATLNIDIDGDTRPQNNRSDMGADEYKP
jgi:hypothetical protein